MKKRKRIIVTFSIILTLVIAAFVSVLDMGNDLKTFINLSQTKAEIDNVTVPITVAGQVPANYEPKVNEVGNGKYEVSGSYTLLAGET